MTLHQKILLSAYKELQTFGLEISEIHSLSKNYLKDKHGILIEEDVSTYSDTACALIYLFLKLNWYELSSGKIDLDKITTD
jgi:hypothetical protein